MVGRLDGTADGRPVNLVAQEGDLTLDVGGVLNMLRLRRYWPAVSALLTPLFRWTGARIQVRAGWLGVLELSPRPGLLLRTLLPSG